MYTEHFCSEEQSLWQKYIVYLYKQENQYTLFCLDSIHVTVCTVGVVGAVLGGKGEPRKVKSQVVLEAPAYNWRNSDQTLLSQKSGTFFCKQSVKRYTWGFMPLQVMGKNYCKEKDRTNRHLSNETLQNLLNPSTPFFPPQPDPQFNPPSCILQ